MGTGAYIEEIGKNRKCFFDHLGGWIGLKFLVLAWFTWTPSYELVVFTFIIYSEDVCKSLWRENG